MRRIAVGDEWEYIEDVVPVLPDGINGDVSTQRINDLVYVGPMFPTVESIKTAIAQAQRQKLKLRRIVVPDLDGGTVFGVPIVTRNPWRDE